ncbi:MAG TPA: TIGR03936 family radical SAM-associated protein [Phycisphaerae bacterium]|nr:TIGR03936 family radical SAM-associated protein [Phycisphaerae bacterium]
MIRPPEQHRQAIDFSVEGDVRFLAHLDTVRLFARAAVRGRVAVRYSEGFNPHPRMSIPLPRPVGIASNAERLVLELAEPLAEEEALRRLQAQVPQGITLIRARRLAPGERCVPVSVTYRVNLPVQDPSAIEDRAAALLGAVTLPVQRTNPKSGRAKEVDLRPCLKRVAVDDGGVEMELSVTGGTLARPAEVMALLGLEAEPVNHRTRRLEIEWQ